MIVIGEPTAGNLAGLVPHFEVLGLVPAEKLDRCRNRHGFGTWLEWTADAFDRSFSESVLARAVIVCDGLDTEFSGHPSVLLAQLRRWLKYAPICLLASGPGELSVAALERLLISEGLNLEFIGLTASDNTGYEKTSALAVMSGVALGRAADKAPADFRVVAFMAAYNEEDIIVHSIRDWTHQGIAVHILENWSTDATYDLARQFESEGLVTVERFPKDGPSPTFDWGAILTRIDELTQEIQADWFVRRGADEVLAAPWPGVSYRNGLYLVDRAGFNCIDHTVIEFLPVDDGFEAGSSHEAYFEHYEFAKNPAHFQQRKAWKHSGQAVSTVASGGHDVPFEGRRVFPFKFLLKHYPVRSQEHGERKVFLERKARWNPEERAKGWHNHYDSMEAGHVFLHPPLERERFSQEHFNRTYLVERLSGVGILR
jgi:hypothetical protein